MNGRVIFWSSLAVLLSATLVWAGDPWKGKPYTEWSAADVWKVLENSPWAKQVGTVSLQEAGVEQEAKGREPWRAGMVFDPRTREWRYDPDSVSKDEHQRAVARKTRFIVLWFSALTVRQALVRKQQLYERSNEEQARQLLSWQPEQYVIFVYGPDTRTLAPLTEDAVRESAYLQPKRSKQRIAPARVQFIRQRGLLAEVRFYFPRAVAGKPAIAPNEKKVKFHCPSSAATISTDFNLRKMTRDGKPDL